MNRAESAATTAAETNEGSWFVALDIDGITIEEHGATSDAVIDQVRRLDAVGHQVMFATGRSLAAIITPVLEQLGLMPQFLVYSNGAIALHSDPRATDDCRREWVESFDPISMLRSIRGHLGNAHFAVEDERVHYRYTGPFPDATIGLDSEHVRFDELLKHPVTRVAVIGVSVVADGLRDIDLLSWASDRGGGVAMGPPLADEIDVAGELTQFARVDGFAHGLATL